jgi:DNA methylase.
LEEGIRPRDFLDDITNDRGTADLKPLGLNDVFTFPKPVDLLTRIMTWIADPAALCVDFFAGSGTMGQAVFEINQLDGGHRRFVLVQLPEPTKIRNFPQLPKSQKNVSVVQSGKSKKRTRCFPATLVFAFSSLILPTSGPGIRIPKIWNNPFALILSTSRWIVRKTTFSMSS